MIIKCAIIDDEPLAAGLLKSYAEKTPFLQLIGSYGSALEAMKELRDNPAQLLFLDIQMPELSGIEFAKVLPPSTKIVFTTAFQQYAIEGYKVNALDYLTKPISYQDFLNAANKAMEWFTFSQKQQACMNMKKLEDYLQRPEFLRTHRSYIIHMVYAEAVDRLRIVIGDQFIPISDSYKDEVLQYFDRHTLA